MKTLELIEVLGKTMQVEVPKHLKREWFPFASKQEILYMEYKAYIKHFKERSLRRIFKAAFLNDRVNYLKFSMEDTATILFLKKKIEDIGLASNGLLGIYNPCLKKIVLSENLLENYADAVLERKIKKVIVHEVAHALHDLNSKDFQTEIKENMVKPLEEFLELDIWERHEELKTFYKPNAITIFVEGIAALATCKVAEETGEIFKENYDAMPNSPHFKGLNFAKKVEALLGENPIPLMFNNIPTIQEIEKPELYAVRLQ